MDNKFYESDEINLFALISSLMRRKYLIIGITLFAMIVLFTLSFISVKLPTEKSFLPNVYTPEALILINDATSNSSLSSMLSSSGLGSLASLAGINGSGSSSYSKLAIFLAGTNTFLDSVVEKFNLIERYKIKEYVKSSSRSIVKGNLSAEIDTASGVFKISYTDIDPVFAHDVVNFCVSYFEQRFAEMGLDKKQIQKENLELNIKNTYNEIRRLNMENQLLGRTLNSSNNESSSIILEATRLSLELEAQKTVYTQLKSQYEVLKVAMASETPIFQVLEWAEVPERKSGPSRGKICVFGSFAAFLLSVIIALILNAIENNKKINTAKIREVN